MTERQRDRETERKRERERERDRNRDRDRERRERDSFRREKSRRERVARNARKVAKHCVFPMYYSSGRSKGRLAKREGEELSGELSG